MLDRSRGKTKGHSRMRGKGSAGPLSITLVPSFYGIIDSVKGSRGSSAAFLCVRLEAAQGWGLRLPTQTERGLKWGAKYRVGTP